MLERELDSLADRKFEPKFFRPQHQGCVFGSWLVKNRRHLLITFLKEQLKSVAVNYDLILLCVVTMPLSDYAIAVLQTIPRSIVGFRMF